MNDAIFYGFLIVLVAVVISIAAVAFKGTAVERKVSGWVDMLHGEKLDDE